MAMPEGSSSTSPRFVCVCHMGICRSGALVLALRESGVDAIAVSAYLGSLTHRYMLYEWATYIVVMQPHFANEVPEQYASKLRCLDVGEDIWSNPTHPELLGFTRETVADWKAREWAI